MRGIVFDADASRPWLAARSVRSLRRAGLREVEVGGALGSLEFRGPSPVLLLRAGAWWRDVGLFTAPPASALDRPLIALGQPHSGEHCLAWRAARQECGGDFDRASSLPPLVSAWLDEAVVEGWHRDGERTLAGLWEGVARTGSGGMERCRVIQWHRLDVEDDRGLRVLQIVTSLQHGGAEQVVWNLHNVLPRKGVASGIVTLGKPLRRTLREPRCWADLSPWDRQERAVRLEQLATHFGADVLHGHLLDGEDVRRFSSWDIPLVLTVHNGRLGWPQGLAQLELPHARLLMACAQAVERDLVAAGLTLPVRTVWNGVDVESGVALRSARPSDGEPETAARLLTLLCIANPRTQKRLERLPAILEAVRRELRRRNLPSESRLIIAGEVSPRSAEATQCYEATQAEALRLGVVEGIEWTHGESPVAEVLARSDVLVSTSGYEGISLGQLEALAAGLPLVVTDVGGAREVAWRRRDVTLLQANASPEEFATAVLAAVERRRSPGAWVEMPDFTRETMTERCAWLYEALWMPQGGSCYWFVTNHLSTGGAQSSLRRLVRAIHAAGHRVRVAVLQEYFDYPTYGRQELEAAGIAVTVLPPAGTIDSAEAVARLLRVMRIDPPRAVMFWNAIPVYKVLLADALWQVPVWDVSPGEMYFASLERYFAQPRPGLPYRTTQEYGARLAGVVVKYQGEAARAAECLGVPVEVIPNGVVLEKWEGEREQEQDVPFCSVLVLGTAARIHPQKRLEDLIEAFRLALPQLSPCLLRIAGGVDEGGEAYAAGLREMACGLPVEWVGDCCDIVGFHRELDLFLMIAEPAGCPNASLEAMAAGLPVIATDVGGAREQIRNGIEGRMVAARDPVAFAAAMVELAADPVKRAQMGAAARQRVMEQFSLERMVQRYLEVLTPGH